MTYITNVDHVRAKEFFLKSESYFNNGFPPYIDFTSILQDVDAALSGKPLSDFGVSPEKFKDVNYEFTANKDGRLAWRPFELMHPALYVALVNIICEQENWNFIAKRIEELSLGFVESCGIPIISDSAKSDQAEQVGNWWTQVEQKSLIYSLEFSHLLHSDVTDCYGALYTHSISWALHGQDVAKSDKNLKTLLGNRIDKTIQSSRYGQTNGICQGSVLMDFVAEIVLSYVDSKITEELKILKFRQPDFRIIRYRDDYRIFGNSDMQVELILKVVSESLRAVGMKLGVSKTRLSTNVIEGSVKQDKLSGLDLQDLGDDHAKTFQKKLLRVHSFGMRFQNSGALKVLTLDLHKRIEKNNTISDNIPVEVAISADIAFISPNVFPPIAAILSHLISRAPQDQKISLWMMVHEKMRRLPNNGYLEVWLQRVTKHIDVQFVFLSTEKLCKVVNGEKNITLWNNDWISSVKLKKALEVKKLIKGDLSKVSETIPSEELALFEKKVWSL